ncbi:MAG: iron-sulfur cluster assembly scaffold protein [Verrucomicrobiota bacterium]
MAIEDATQVEYTEAMLGLHRSPHHFGTLPRPDQLSSAEGYNPLCGDRVVIELSRQSTVHFHGESCLVSRASASLLTRYLDSPDRFQESEQILAALGDPAPSLPDGLDVLRDLLLIPGRLDCARLPWLTFRAALAKLAD